MTNIIRIAAALLTRPDGRVLLVRKRDTTAFMQPGGKIAPYETPLRALVRELWEELGFSADPADFVHLGRFTAPAANEPGEMVDAEIYSLEIEETVKAASEIAELAWVDALSPGLLDLAPLTRDHILPLHAGRRIKHSGRHREIHPGPATIK